ncbi:STAS domain-containing protein [Actimicrobium sp. CCC2.4]|uniref:STAS domain-containing protein n=2 Tax=Actimicrobium sp. CCC2.4 TaxID=3048606 RepID=UPI002AC8D5CD|nr:STAS domain-containing protein [Actimicrobium sp. CCC2.4]WPX31707.1 STAS domain-containing protein [Actimicrobium sp. CCC2.4]
MMKPVMITISGELTIYQVAETRALLQRALTGHDGSDQLMLDLAGVTECDGAGVQLLLAFSQAVSAGGTDLVLCYVAPFLAELLREFGLGSRFAECAPAVAA